MGICTLGSTMTNFQMRRFVAHFAGHTVVLMYDPDVRGDRKKWPGIERMIAKLKGSLPNGLAVVWLPEGQDPGSLDRQYLRGYVTDEARKQGIRVSWKKR